MEKVEKSVSNYDGFIIMFSDFRGGYMIKNNKYGSNFWFGNFKSMEEVKSYIDKYWEE